MMNTLKKQNFSNKLKVKDRSRVKNFKKDYTMYKQNTKQKDTATAELTKTEETKKQKQKEEKNSQNQNPRKSKHKPKLIKQKLCMSIGAKMMIYKRPRKFQMKY